MNSTQNIWEVDSEKKEVALKLLNKISNSIYPDKISKIVEGFVLRKYGGSLLIHIDEITDSVYSEIIDYIIKKCLEIYSNSQSPDDGYKKIIDYLKSVTPKGLVYYYLKRFSSNIIKRFKEKFSVKPFEEETYEEALDRVFYEASEYYDLEPEDEEEFETISKDIDCLSPKARELKEKTYKNLKTKTDFLTTLKDNCSFSLDILVEDNQIVYDDFLYDAFENYYLEYLKKSQYDKKNYLLHFYIRMLPFLRFMSNFIIYNSIKQIDKSSNIEHLVYSVSFKDVVLKSIDSIESIKENFEKICFNLKNKDNSLYLDNFAKFLYAFSNTNFFIFLDGFRKVSDFSIRMIDIYKKHAKDFQTSENAILRNGFDFSIKVLNSLNRKFETYMTALYNFCTNSNKKTGKIRNAKDIKSLFLKIFYFYFYFYFDVLRYQTSKSWFRKLEPVDKAFNIVYKSVIYESIREI